MAMANINKKHFLLAGSCAVVRSVFSRSSLGGRRQGIRGVKEIGILIKVLFCANTPNFIQIGGRAYPVRHYPIAVRLRDRKGHAILCIALNPQSGDFSDAILEVPSEALLHLRKVLFREKAPEYHSGVIDKECICKSRCCAITAQECLGSRDMLKIAKRTQERFCSMYCVHPSEWGLFGRNTRSAIQGTSSSPRVSGH